TPLESDMGRNMIPKIGEWRDGSLYRFRVSTKTPNAPVSADGGDMIVYERLFYKSIGNNGERIEACEVLASWYADGLQTSLAAIYEAGLSKGKRMGREDALGDVRRVLGLRDEAESG